MYYNAGMKCSTLKFALVAGGLAVLAVTLVRVTPPSIPAREGRPDGPKVVKTDAEWRAQLTPEEYRVTRRAHTERPFTGRYWNTRTEGMYVCVGCGQPLFDSRHKFDSGCGWPSFWDPRDSEAITLRPDHSLMVSRTEVVCSLCDAHLGHVFEDGPPPTGLRFCINSASLKLIPRGGAEKSAAEPGPPNE